METVRRGYEPKDMVEFGSKAVEKMRAAALPYDKRGHCRCHHSGQVRQLVQFKPRTDRKVYFGCVDIPAGRAARIKVICRNQG